VERPRLVKSGVRVRRVATNVKKDDGSRAIGTISIPKGKAIAAIAKGKAIRRGRHPGQALRHWL